MPRFQSSHRTTSASEVSGGRLGERLGTGGGRPRRPPAPPGVGMRLTKAPRGQSRHVPWSTLLWRTFDVVGAACPVCGQVMVLRAVVRGPETGRVLAGLARAARGPPMRDLGEAGA